jgi:hypothetical protein
VLNKIKNRIREKIGRAIDWRVRDVLEADRQATLNLGKTFIEGAAQLTDQQRLLELQVANLEKRIAELENRK